MSSPGSIHKHQAFIPAHEWMALVRALEALRPQGAAPIGEAARLKDEWLLLGQWPFQGFATQDMGSVHWPKPTPGPVSRPSIDVQNFGLLGPNGAMPLHWTEHAYQRANHHRDDTLIAFLNVFNQRLYSLFYQAWCRPRPALRFHETQPNPFTRQLAALVGHGTQTHWWRETALDPVERLGLAAHSTRQTRSPESVSSVLSTVTGAQVCVEGMAARWLTLGQPTPQALGKGARLGRRVWDVQSCVRIALQAESQAHYLSLMRGGRLADRLAQAIYVALGHEYDSEVRITVAAHHRPDTQLGAAGLSPTHQACLGRTAWLGRPKHKARYTVRWRRPSQPQLTHAPHPFNTPAFIKDMQS